MNISELEESLYINTMMYELVISFSDCYDILFHSIDINQLCPYIVVTGNNLFLLTWRDLSLQENP